MRRMDVRGGSLVESAPLSLGSRLRRALLTGQTMVEYALLLSLVALALVGTIGGMAGQVGGRFNAISNTLASGGNGGLGPGTTVPDGGDGPTTSPSPSSPQTPPANTGGNGSDGNNGNNGSNGKPGESLPQRGKNLSDYTWKEISLLSKDAIENESEYEYLIGQSKAVNFKGYGMADMMLIGINHDDKADGTGKVGFTFMAKQAITTSLGFKNTANGLYTIKNGWKDYFLRDTCNNNIYNSLASDLKSLIVKVKKSYYSGDGKEASMKSTDDYIWLPSYYELYGTNLVGQGTYDSGQEGNLYAYWGGKDATEHIIKYKNNATKYWLRTLQTIDLTGCIAIVEPYGKVVDTPYQFPDSTTAGIVPCFCI